MKISKTVGIFQRFFADFFYEFLTLSCVTAMKHFRASYALDPAYFPARYNLECFGNFYPKGKWAYDEIIIYVIGLRAAARQPF